MHLTTHIYTYRQMYILVLDVCMSCMSICIATCIIMTTYIWSYIYLYAFYIFHTKYCLLALKIALCVVYVSAICKRLPICHLEIFQANNEAYCVNIHIGHMASVFQCLASHSPSSPINHVFSNSRGNGNRSRGN